MEVACDDLPPREVLPERTGSPGSSSLQAEKGKETQETADSNGDAAESAPTVPLHAGFDFAAIKDVLRESKERDGEKLSASSLSSVPEHLIPPASPITRSGSAPPYTSTHRPPFSSQLSRGFTSDDDANEDGASDDLSSGFSRSFSLADAPSTGRNKGITSLNNTLDSGVPMKPPLSSNSPQLSFGGYDGSVWQASPTDGYQSGTVSSTRSLSLLGEGRGNGSSGYLSSPSIDPFASPPTLSFGGPGGTIGYEPSTSVVPPSNHEADPWSSVTRGKKAINGPNSNPWA